MRSPKSRAPSAPPNASAAPNIAIGQPEIVVPPLSFACDQLPFFQPGQMPRRRLALHPRLRRQLSGGQRLAAHQRRQHVGASGVADQGGDAGNVGSVFHDALHCSA